MEKLGCRVDGVDLHWPRVVRGVLRKVFSATGNGPEYDRTFIHAKLNGLRLRQKHQGSGIYLHMGTRSMPAGSLQNAAKHSIYLDSTFHLMQPQSLANFSPRVRKQYEDFEKWAIKKAAYLFTTADYVKRDLATYYEVPEDRISVVGTGRGKIQASGDSKDYSTRTTLFVAKERFMEKGGQLLLDGFKLAVAADPRLKLIVVGQEQYRAAVEAVPNATFKTALPWEELELLFNQASLFAMPAQYEPWGLVYLEALACGTPVLGLNRNALPEFTLNGASGFLLDQATAEAVAAGLKDAFSNIDRLARMGQLGQKHVLEHYDWDLTGRKIYATLFGERPLNKRPLLAA